jgi:zinc protease
MSDAPGDILPFTPLEATLGNGLRVIVVPTGFPNLVSLQIPVQTGSRNEIEPGLSGFAHFFEHMMFRGTERYPASAYSDIMTHTGARQNAYTTDDYTNYHATFAAEDLETVLDIEADRFMNLAYSEEDFRTEARAVLGEYNKNSANPMSKLIEVMREHAYTTHTYQHTTMGFLRDIEDMPNQYAYSRVFFDRWYRPEYTSVIVAGDVEPERVLALVERYWGGWRAGSHAVAIPREPEPHGPVTAHVPWSSPTLPWVTVAFHGPAFSETEPDFAALDTLLDLRFGRTSDLYRRLVEVEQTVDRLAAFHSATADPSLAMIAARVKRPDNAPAVFDAILSTVAEARRDAVAARRLEDAKSYARYAFARTLDNSESIAAALARFVRFRRSAETLNALFRRYDALTPDDLHAAANRYLQDARMVVTTLSHEPLPELRVSASEAPQAAAELPTVLLPSPSPLLCLKLLFAAGSAYDPPGKEGLAALAAGMIAGAGSKELRIDEITRALFPMAGSFHAQVDREMTTVTGVIHRDNAERFADIALKQLVEPGLRETDFTRLKQNQMNALVQDLRANNDEELGKERLQATIFAGTPYGHPVLGTVAGIESITLDDVRAFIERMYTRAGLTVGLAGDVPQTFITRLQRDLRSLPEGVPPAGPVITGHRPKGIEIEIIEKDTRATAISLGFPIPVTRPHPDFPALWLARSWLGEHRASQGRLFQRLREARGLNYGDFAYIEAFPRGMYQFSPDPNIARRAQIFEVWVRPVAPEHALFALKAAIHELEGMIERGLSEEEFAATRGYLMKNVFILTTTQQQQLGYALDSRWYGMDEFTSSMRQHLASLTADQVNEAVRRHLTARDLSVVIVTRDAAGLRDELLSGRTATVSYAAAMPADLLEEDRVIGARDLRLDPGKVRITPVEEVWRT